MGVQGIHGLRSSNVWPMRLLHRSNSKGYYGSTMQGNSPERESKLLGCKGPDSISQNEWTQTILRQVSGSFWNPKKKKKILLGRKGKAGESQSGYRTSWEHTRSPNRVPTILPSRTSIVMAGGLLESIQTLEAGGNGPWAHSGDRETVSAASLHLCYSATCPGATPGWRSQTCQDHTHGCGAGIQTQFRDSAPNHWAPESLHFPSCPFQDLYMQFRWLKLSWRKPADKTKESGWCFTRALTRATTAGS